MKTRFLFALALALCLAASTRADESLLRTRQAQDLLTERALTRLEDDGIPTAWLRSCVTTWPVAFPTVAVVAPLVRRVVTRVTA